MADEHRTVPDCETIHKELVTKEYCAGAHKSIGRQLTFAGGVLTLFLVLVGWSLFAGSAAKTVARQVDGRFQVHEGKQQEHEKHLHEALLRIEKSIELQGDEMKEQRVMITDMWHKNGGGASHNDGSIMQPIAREK